MLFSPEALHRLRKVDFDFLQLYGKDNCWKTKTTGGLDPTETKIAAARFLTSGAFVDAERFLPALFASTDPNTRLSEIGDNILKRVTPSISLESKEILDDLFAIYGGSKDEDGGSLPARVSLQIKILALLCKSTMATTYTFQIIQIIGEGFAGYNMAVNSYKRGLEVVKVHDKIFAFINWLARVGSRENLATVAKALIPDIRLHIEHLGWPTINVVGSQVNPEEISARSYGYAIIGILASACPRDLLWTSDTDLIRWLFMSLGCDNSGKDISLRIEETLSSILNASGNGIDVKVQSSLINLVFDQSLSTVGAEISGHKCIRSTHYMAVRFANRCLPFSNVKARWINLLVQAGSPGERYEVLEEGKRGLDPFWLRNMNQLSAKPEEFGNISDEAGYDFPNFEELTLFLFGDQTGFQQTGRRRFGSVYSAAAVFCRYVLLHQALTSKGYVPIIDAEWKKNIDALLVTDGGARDQVKAYLTEHYGTEIADTALSRLLHATLTSLVDESLGDAEASAECLLSLCSICSVPALDCIAPRVSELKIAINSEQHFTRTYASHIFGLLSRSNCPAGMVDELLRTFVEKCKTWQQAVGLQVNQVHGSLLGVAYWASRTHNIRPETSAYQQVETKFLAIVLTILATSSDKYLSDAAVLSVDQLCLFGLLTPSSLVETGTLAQILKNLDDRSKAGDEKAVLALGHLAMQCSEDEDDSTLGQILTILYALHENRQPELQFAVGAALSCAGSGWQSKSLVGVLDIEGGVPTTPARFITLSAIVQKILTDCKTTKPALRQGSVIWLLSLVQYCGHEPQMQDQLRQCQSAFKSFLSDRESLNQETAARGLTAVYEKGNQSLKDDLVRDLFGSFIGTNAGLAGNVSQDTQLFETGALPTGDGSVTTYKDIMSLANEVGDSTLVYRFMSLASNNAIWSSRAAFGRFGLSSILSDSGYASENPKLYPALFRYRFDPNSNVRTAMNDIWSTLVKDSAKTIDVHFDHIVEDLLKNILAREWRVRQSSCDAIAYLVQAKPLEKYERYLNQLWTLSFKACSVAPTLSDMIFDRTLTHASTGM